MALFRTSLRTFSRSKGDSATAAAAYRAGVDVPDDRLGVTHRFSKRQGVESVRLFAPVGAPSWASDVTKLWNAAEAAETRCNARVARELVVALPHELSASQRSALAEAISQALVDRYSMAVMLAVHAPDAKGDQRNHHCHIMMSTREMTPTGFGAKVRTLDDRVQGPLEVEFLRTMVEQRTNTALEAAKVDERVDRRSLQERAKAAEAAGDFERAATLTREPTLVVGRAGIAATRRGVAHERAQTNVDIRAGHAQDLAVYLARVQAGGRLMPPASDRAPGKIGAPLSVPAAKLLSQRTNKVSRATGADARLLNDQAAASEESRRVSEKVQREYIESLLRDLVASQRWLDAYLALMQREHERTVWLQRCAADRELEGLLRQSVEARIDLRDLRKKEVESRARLQDAMALRRKEQTDADAEAASKVPVWNFAARRRWKTKHVAQAARLRQAVLNEQGVRQSVSSAAVAETRKRAAALRTSMARADEAIRARIESGVNYGGPAHQPREERDHSLRGRRFH